MAVDSDLPNTPTVQALCDVPVASDADIKRLETYIANATPETEFTMNAGQLMSLLKRIKANEA